MGRSRSAGPRPWVATIDARNGSAARGMTSRMKRPTYAGIDRGLFHSGESAVNRQDVVPAGRDGTNRDTCVRPDAISLCEPKSASRKNALRHGSLPVRATVLVIRGSEQKEGAATG